MSIWGSKSKMSSQVSTQSSSPLGPSMKPSTDMISAAMIFLILVVLSHRILESGGWSNLTGSFLP